MEKGKMAKRLYKMQVEGEVLVKEEGRKGRIRMERCED